MNARKGVSRVELAESIIRQKSCLFLEIQARQPTAGSSREIRFILQDSEVGERNTKLGFSWTFGTTGWNRRLVCFDHFKRGGAFSVSEQEAKGIEASIMSPGGKFTSTPHTRALRRWRREKKQKIDLLHL
ncbi:MAG: hypothetical protein ACLR6J_10155 [Parabacteroides merdae]